MVGSLADPAPCRGARTGHPSISFRLAFMRSPLILPVISEIQRPRQGCPAPWSKTLTGTKSRWGQAKDHVELRSRCPAATHFSDGWVLPTFGSSDDTDFRAQRERRGGRGEPGPRLSCGV